MSFRLLELPDALRDQDLEPLFVAGWETRGADFPRPPIGSIDHETIGAATGFAPSLGVVTNGRSDLPGPLSNVLEPRLLDGDHRVYVVAAGKANHAGRGLWLGADSNYELTGLEREGVGYGRDLTPWRTEVSARVHAAFAALCGFTAEHVASHAEYALPHGRKSDVLGEPMGPHRARIDALLQHTTPTDDLLEELLLTIAKNDDDARRTYVRQASRRLLGRSPGPTEYAKWLGVLVDHGAEALEVELGDSAEGVEWRKRDRALRGYPSAQQ